MKKIRVMPRVALACIALLAWFEICQPTARLRADDGGTEFILCAPDDRVAAVAARYGLTIIRPIDEHGHNVYLVSSSSIAPSAAPAPDSPSGTSTPTATDTLISQVRADPDVEHFDINGTATITETHPGAQLNESTVAILDSLSNPTLTDYFGSTVWSQYVSQPAMGVIRLPDAQSLANGTGVIVAVIDTGVDPDHAVLSGALVPGYDFTRDIAGSASEWADLSESTVAILDNASASILDSNTPVTLNESTVAILDSATAASVDVTQLPPAFGHGTMTSGLVHLVAPGAQIMPLKAFRADGTSKLFDIERAIYYAVDHGAKVINMSFSMSRPSAELTHAIDYAGEHGVICIASAGNAGRSAVIFPGAYRNVIAVASTTLTDDRSTFTNYGDHLVTFAAPGEGLITLYPGQRYASVSGTSFSTALVTGGAVLMAQLEPTVDQRLFSRYFDDGAVKLQGAELGDGRIDLFATLRTHATTLTTTVPTRPTGDTVPPTVALTSPAPGASATGVVQLAAAATDDVGVVGVQFTVDGAAVGLEAATAPYLLNWDTTTVPNGVHAIAAIARDAAGNTQIAASVGLTVVNDTTPPTVTLTSPAAGTAVSGAIALGANATDDTGVVGVQFAVDGVALGAERTAAPYATTWDSSSVPNGTHVLSATARDAAGNSQKTTVTVTVTNDTTPPTVALTSPSAGIVTGTVTLAADASDDVGVAGVQFAVDGMALGAARSAVPYATTWNSSTVPNGIHVLSATARDAAGNQQTASVSVTVANDTTPPTITLNSPATGDVVTGTISLAADATDDVGVAGVQFALDGVNLGVEVAADPYARPWNSATVPNGVHTLTATARDAAGNQTVASVTVSVSNDTTPPTVNLTGPLDGTGLSGAVTIDADASDDVAVVGVQFAVDGVAVGSELTTAPYEIVWDSTTVPDGTHVLTATARDAAGNQQTASAVTVTVTNNPSGQ